MKTAFVMILVFLCVALSANFESKLPFEYTQPDGSKLSLFVTGDEYYRRVHDEQDYTILQHPESGYAVYAVPDGKGIKVSDYVVGSLDPAALGIPPTLVQDPSLTRSRISNHEAALGSPDDRAPSTGTINNIFVFCRFSNQAEYTQQQSTYNTMCNSLTEASMRDYFREETANQLTISTTFYPAAAGGIVRSYQSNQPRSYYLPYNASTNPNGYPAGPVDDPNYYGMLRLQTMLRAAVVSIASTVPAGLVIDGDSDGNVDNVTFVCQGAAGNWNDPLWPHHYVLQLPSAVYINNKRVWDYNMQLSNTIRIGVICHEMSHSMGFPDLYHYAPDSTISPVGAWDLMEWDKAIPQHHLTHLKRKYGGWFDQVPTIIPSSTPTVYTLTAVDQYPFACCRINSNVPNEEYMIEYRRKTGRYESSLPGSGLIIYRIIKNFDGSPLNGNRNGPPDEVYIYRPNGTILVNGTVDNANYSSNINRTSIHNFTNPQPWLYSSTHTSLPGNLVITNIGESGGTTMSFMVHLDAPNVWTGSSSTAWHTAANWSLNSLPNSSQYVEIPGGLSRYPVITTDSPYCNQLSIKTGASLTISTGDLHVITDAHIRGALVMNNTAGDLFVGGNLIFESGSTTNISADAVIWVTKDMEVRTGSNVNMANGYLEFLGNSDSNLYMHRALTLNHLRSKKVGSVLSIINPGNYPLTFNADFRTYTGSSTIVSSTGTTIIKGSLDSFDGGPVNFTGGTVSFEGSGFSRILFQDINSYLNHLKINKSGNSLVLSSNARVKGDLTIQSGIFNPASYTLSVGGDWTNNVGPAGFTEGSSAVILNGSSHQYCNNSEDFNILLIHKSGGALRVNSSSAHVTCNTYTFISGAVDVLSGTFTAYDLSQNEIYGNFYVNPGGTINLHKANAQSSTLNGFFYLNQGGTINVYTGGTCYLAYHAPAGIIMSGGNVWFRDGGLNCLVGSHALTLDITGGFIHIGGSLSDSRGGMNFGMGTVDLFGPGDSRVSLEAGSSFYNLIIDKTSGARAEEPRIGNSGEKARTEEQRGNSIKANSDLQINGTLNISAGIFDVNSKTITVNNDLDIRGTLKMTTAGVLNVYGDVKWRPASVSDVTAGNIYCGGDWLFAVGCYADLTGSTTRIEHPYGGEITNYSPIAKFGNLEICATEEDPETNYIYYQNSSTLRVNGYLKIEGSDTFNLNQGNCIVSGICTIDEDCTINQGDAGTLTINDRLQLYGRLITGAGTALVHGLFSSYSSGSLEVNEGIFKNDAPWTISSSSVNLASAVSIIDGIFEITHKSLNIQAHATRIFFNAELRVGGGFAATAAGSYQPTGGGLYQIDTGNSNLTVTGDNYLTNYYVQKTSNSNTVLLQEDITITGNVSITSGTFNSEHHTMAVSGDIGVYGTLALPSDSVLKISPGKNLSIYNGGFFSSYGIETAMVQVTCNGIYGSYGFQVESGGTISASYTSFKSMSSNGVNVKNGAMIDPNHAFNYCKFLSIFSTGNLLTINNAQNIIIDHADFPLTSATGAHNVSKTMDQGKVIFTNFSGPFSGADYELDSYNRIFWNTTGVVEITDLHIERQAPNSIRLWWTYSQPYTQFKIYSSDAPDGTFTLVESTANMYWIGSSTNPHTFYQVTVEAP